MYYDNIDDIREVFKEFCDGGGPTTWVLVDGKGTASYPKTATNTLYRQNANLDIRESWQILEGKLQAFQRRGGYGKLYVGDKDNHIQFPIYFPHLSEQNQGGQGAALGGVPGLGFREALQDKMRIYELERKVEEMSQGPRAEGFVGRIADRFLEDENFVPAITNLTQVLLAKLSGAQLPPPSHLGGTQGVGGQEPEGAAAPTFEERFFYSIRPGFSSDMEMQEYLRKVAAFFSQNPEMAKKVIDSVVQKQGNE